MSDSNTSLAPVGPSAAAELRQRRGDLKWVDDADLRTLSSIDTNAAWALSLFTGGGGQLMVGQYLPGAALIAASILLLWLWWPLFFALGAASSIFAFRSARAVNRYVAARDAHADNSGPTPGAYRLLAAMQANNPGALVDAHNAMQAGWNPGGASGSATPAGGSPAQGNPPGPQIVAGVDVHGLRARLAQLAALRANEVIDDAEYRERRIDALSVLKGLDRDEMDEVLFHLLPLINEGYLSGEDVALLKRMGGG